MRTRPPRKHSSRLALVTAGAALAVTAALALPQSAGAAETSPVGFGAGTNDLGGAATEISQVGTFTKPSYSYTAEPASTVVASVTSGAGAGKL